MSDAAVILCVVDRYDGGHKCRGVRPSIAEARAEIERDYPVTQPEPKEDGWRDALICGIDGTLLVTGTPRGISHRYRPARWVWEDA